MKNLIPIFSITIAAVFMQNCSNRDEDTISNPGLSEDAQTTLMMRGDSTKSSEKNLDPDPPVRDGDNWRHIKNY